MKIHILLSRYYVKNSVYSQFQFSLIQARSEQGSRRLPCERSSEISKNCHWKSVHYFSDYMCVEINHRRKIWAFFCTISCDNFWIWFFILHARGNKSSAANLGLFLHDFVRQLMTLIFHPMYMRVEINHWRRIWDFFCMISCGNFWPDLI